MDIGNIAAQLMRPPILAALLACLVLIVVRKPFMTVVSGALKTAIGYVILTIGAMSAANVLTPINDILGGAYGLRGGMSNDEVIASMALSIYGSEALLVMLLGFAVNILVARFTRLKYVYLTGHHLLYSSIVILVMFKVQTSLPGIVQVIAAGCILGIYCPLIIALVQPYMNKVTGESSIGYANSTNMGALLGGLLGKIAGNRERNADDIKLPKWLDSLSDMSILTSIAVMLIYLLLAVLVGPADMMRMVKSQNESWIVWSLLQGVKFGASLTILFAGMRLFISEIMTALMELAHKVVEGVIPGFDTSVVMSYAPKAWMLGFIISYTIGIILSLIMLFLRVDFVIIAGIGSHFFASGAAAVFGNATGGRRGAVIAAAATGIIISIVPAFLMPMMGPIAGYGMAWGETEYGIWGSILGYILQLFNNIGR